MHARGRASSFPLRVLLLALAGSLLFSPTPTAQSQPYSGKIISITPAPNLQPGDYQFAFAHDGRNRNYLVHVPPHAVGAALPVVLNFHGGGGEAEGQRDHSQMNPLADREGFIVVYPNGTGFFGNRLLTWNAGTCCGYAMKNRVDDVGFALALLDDLGARTQIDRRRVYATGHSNGAMMAYRLAVEAGDHFAAIAPVSGAMVVTDFHPSRPMPIMHFHSVDDPRALYYGGLGPPFPMTNNRVMHPNVETMLAQWRAFDQCPADAQVAPTISGKPGSPDDGITATKYTWGPCAAGTEVVLWKLTGAGHTWPGGKQGVFPRLLGRGTMLIDANEEMWRFFSRFSLPEKSR